MTGMNMGPKVLAIGQLYTELLERNFDRFSHALARSKSRSYGPGDCFRDWSEAASHATTAWCQLVSIVFEHSTRYTISAAVGDPPRKWVIPVAVAEATELDSKEVQFFRCPLPNGDHIGFQAEFDGAQRNLIITLESLDKAVAGLRYPGEVIASSGETFELLLEID